MSGVKAPPASSFSMSGTRVDGSRGGGNRLTGWPCRSHRNLACGGANRPNRQSPDPRAVGLTGTSHGRVDQEGASSTLARRTKFHLTDDPSTSLSRPRRKR